MAHGARGERPPEVDGVTDSDWQDQFDSSSDFDPDELREFLAADMMQLHADPDFKERLRRKLWLVVKRRYGRGPSKTR